MATFDDFGYERGDRYAISEWVKFQALQGKPIYILDAWKAEGKFGPQLRFIFAASNGTDAKVFASSTGSELISRQVLGVKASGTLPRFAQIEKYDSEKSPQGYGWRLKDIQDTCPEPGRTLMVAAALAAKESAKQEDHDAPDLPDDLPF